MGRGGEVGHVNVSVFGAGGEAAAKMLAKGWLVAVDRRLQYGRWEIEDGEKRHDYTIGDNSVMGKLEPSSNMPATDASFDVLARVAGTDREDRYPDGTVLLPADATDSSLLIARAIGEGRPIAVVFPDGSDMLARPPETTGLALAIVVASLWLADWARRRSDGPTFVPREWVTELHAAPSLQTAEPSG